LLLVFILSIKATLYLLNGHLGDFCRYTIYENLQDLDEFKTILKPRLKLILQNDEREWFIVFVSKAHPSNDQTTKKAKKVYARLEADFNTKKRERYLSPLLHDRAGCICTMA
jgi:hypothetical protein